MAIKRPSKSLGAPVRRATSSPGLRHVEILAPQRMIAGNSYIGWLCKNKACGRVIAIAAAADDKSTASDDQLAAIKCPHCGDEDLYRWSARGEHVYVGASGAT